MKAIKLAITIFAVAVCGTSNAQTLDEIERQIEPAKREQAAINPAIKYML